jgi:hypothetical protein
MTERLAEHLRSRGASALGLTTGQLVARLQFETAVQEVLAMTMLPGRLQPDLINNDDALLEDSFIVCKSAIAEVLAALRAPAESALGAAGSVGSGTRLAGVREGGREAVHQQRLFNTLSQ